MRPLLFRDIQPINVPIPPVTGYGGNNLPVANSYDDTRTFRNRTGSYKRRRHEGQDDLIDAVYDLTHDFPPVAPPNRPAVNVATIKSVLVEATVMAEELKSVIDNEEISDREKKSLKLICILTSVVESIVENGIEPLASVVVAGGGNTSSRSFAAAARRLANPPPPQEAGRKELAEALHRADKESVLFGADLGGAEMAHRGSLNAAFTTDLRARTVGGVAGGDPGAVAESLRVVEDALSCVENLEFLGQRSRKYRSPGGTESNYCSMPIKLSFADKDARLNFERTVRSHTGLRVSQSLPQPIRSHMAAFRRALEDRYRGSIVMVRPEPKRLELIAFRKAEGEGRWTNCTESIPIPSGILLPGFAIPETICLPEVDGMVTGTASGNRG